MLAIASIGAEMWCRRIQQNGQAQFRKARFNGIAKRDVNPTRTSAVSIFAVAVLLRPP
jgi:hypothetical protein